MNEIVGIDYRRPTNEFVSSIDVHTLLPQAEPFVMIENIIHFDMEKIVTSMTFSAQNIFANGGYVSSEGLIENIAQTCAARIGYINKYILKKGIQIGYIGAVKNFKVNKLPDLSETINTEVIVVDEVFDMVLAKADVRALDGILLASSDIKIAIKEEV